MAPKRKATASGKGGGKVAKVETKTAVKAAIKQLKAADTGKTTHTPDKVAPIAVCGRSLSVYIDYDCMLNQTNIGHNNNKYYIIQILTDGKSYFTWNRWGRVGERGANKFEENDSLEAAIKDFEKKFKDKTKNSWDDRDNFKPVPGKYHLLDMADDAGSDDDDDVVDSPISALVSASTLPSKLDDPTQLLMQLIFDNDMFRDAMVNLKIDVRKMPLGKLSKTQIAKGFECLTEIGDVLSKKKSGNLTELSSKFYTVVPHDFGRNVPPKIADADTLQNKLDMLTVLGDIEIAQSLQKTKKAPKIKNEPHPLDVNYGLLNCRLTHVKPSSHLFKVIQKYTTATGRPSGPKIIDVWEVDREKEVAMYMMVHDVIQKYTTATGRPSGPKIIDVWEVDREMEGDKFKAHNSLKNRKLLWHGTNVAVVAAILKTGLRIMPHSGGRVGKGIYFASENSKSAGYVCPSNNRIGIMFLNEVALGKEFTHLQGDGSLKKAPNGYDSIVARGWTEPDSKSDIKIKLEANDVTVPQGKPTNTTYKGKSSFSQSEYLVYKESQCRIRYLLKMKF